jgi:DNA-binding winged helix-turn-helix (wHTH) protein
LSPSPLFLGRDAELARVESAFSLVTLAWVDGVAGVGKSTLALAFAERWPGAVVVCQAGSLPLEALLDDARMALGPPEPPEPRDNATRIADLIRRLEAKSALFVLDDAHKLEKNACAEVVNELALHLSNARAIITSRQRWEGGSRAPDHAELHLEGLDVEAARKLWTTLDALHGPADGFEAARQRWHGNPLFLRRAHAGSRNEDDPVKSQVEELPALSRRLGVALALASQSLPAVTLSAVLGSEGESALRSLETALVVEVDRAGNARVHDLFRDALLASATSAEQTELRELLATALSEASLEIRIQLREVTRQLVALGRFVELDAFLLRHVAGAVRSGATGELLRSIERVPETERSVALRIERARCIGRHYDQRLAFAELERLLEEAGSSPPPELSFAFAEAAYDRCRVEQVISTLAPLLARDDVSPSLRLNALSRYTAALTVMGRGDEGRRVLLEEEERTTDPAVRARLALHVAMLHNADEEYGKAAGALARARLLIEKNAIEENAVYVPLTFAVIYARAGRFDESDALLTGLDLHAAFEDESAQEFVTASRASLAFERGDRHNALADRLVAERRNEALGNVHYAFTNAIWHSRLLFALGRRHEASALIEAALPRARELGCAGIEARLERSRERDPVREVRRELARPSAARRGDLGRWLALTALTATVTGSASAERALREAESACSEPGYGLERAILHLCRSDLAKARGSNDEARRERELGEAEALRENVDGDLLGLLLEAARRRNEPIPSADAVVLDGTEHEVRTSEHTVSLRTRPVLRRLLYALAASPRALVSKEALVQSTWSVAYDPLRHDTALWQNIHRLRRLLEPTGLGIEVDELGYRLTTPKSFRFAATASE